MKISRRFVSLRSEEYGVADGKVLVESRDAVYVAASTDMGSFQYSSTTWVDRTTGGLLGGSSDVLKARNKIAQGNALGELVAIVTDAVGYVWIY